ncbi:MAG: alpha/beta fold hydrolase [Solirubrobacterales bacterium]
MGRRWKILIGVLAAIAVLLGVNALVTGAETKPAEVTEPGGRILALQGGQLQVVDRGPRGGSPIVLIHCFTCAIEWWDRMTPRLLRRHRVVAIDLLGHGGSEKPSSGYSIGNQADIVAEALNRLGVRGATVVGHSLGGSVAVALGERSPQLVERIAIVDTRSSAADEGDLGPIAALAFAPLIGDALWRIKPDFAIRGGLEVAFAPGFDVPDSFVDNVKQMTYSAYDDSAGGFDEYTGEASLAERTAATGKPLLVIMGAEEQIIDDPRAALAAYSAAVPDAQTELIDGVGHSPNVEAPARTAALILGFMQDDVQNRNAVRGRP